MTLAESRHFVDQLEMHILDPKYRYDHIHQPGDVTIWSNFSTMHNAPPAKSVINSPDNARLMYRISCKGSPRYELPWGVQKPASTNKFHRLIGALRASSNYRQNTCLKDLNMTLFVAIDMEL